MNNKFIIPYNPPDLNALKLASVYVFFRCYEGVNSRRLVYVGKSEHFAERLAMHYGDFLSTKVGTLYKDDGSEFRRGGPSEYFRSFQADLEDTLRYAVADARRTRFIYAPVSDKTRLAPIEATIIDRLRNIARPRFELWNTSCRSRLVEGCLIHHGETNLHTDQFSLGELDHLHMVLSACQNG